MSEDTETHWLLLRGLARESGHWGDFIPQLKSAFPKAQITLLDLPGTGKFYRDVSPRSIGAIADKIRSYANEQGYLEKPVSVLALSLGAMVTWQWLQRYPADICRAVLINTSFASLSPFYDRLRWQSYSEFLGLLLTRDIPRRESVIVQLVSNLHQNNPELIENWVRLQRESPISLSTCINQILAAVTYQPDDRKPTQPVLLINSSRDRLVNAVCSEVIANKWRLPLERHPWAGHDLTLDDGNWVASKLREWVSDLQAR